MNIRALIFGCLLTPLAFVEGREIVQMDLSQLEEGAAVPVNTSRDLPLLWPSRIITSGENSVQIGSAAAFGGDAGQRVLEIHKREGSGNVGLEWRWSPLLVSERGALEVSFELWLSEEPGQAGNFMVALNAENSSSPVAYFQIGGDGSLALLDTSVPQGKSNQVAKLVTGSQPNRLRLRIDYGTGETTLFINDEAATATVKFDVEQRVQQAILFAPHPAAARHVGVGRVSFSGE